MQFESDEEKTNRNVICELFEELITFNKFWYFYESKMDPNYDRHNENWLIQSM